MLHEINISTNWNFKEMWTIYFIIGKLIISIHVPHRGRNALA